MGYIKYGILLIALIILSAILYLKNKSKFETSLTLFSYKAHTYKSSNVERELKYRFFTPKVEKDKRYPLVLFLHDGSRKGTDNWKQLSLLTTAWIKKDFQKNNPCYVMVPQCPVGFEWVTIRPKSVPFGHYDQDKFPEGDEMKSMVELINKFKKELPIDSSRIFVVGFSMGATGTWDILTRHPDVFAGGITASGETDTAKASKLINIPVWAFCGEDDNIVYPVIVEDMVNAVNAAGGNIKYTLKKGLDHTGIGMEVFYYPGVKEWLFSIKKKY